MQAFNKDMGNVFWVLKHIPENFFFTEGLSLLFIYFSWYMYNGYNLYVGERREVSVLL